MTIRFGQATTPGHPYPHLAGYDSLKRPRLDG